MSATGTQPKPATAAATKKENNSEKADLEEKRKAAGAGKGQMTDSERMRLSQILAEEAAEAEAATKK